jgi:hypothetical protein
MLRAYLAVVLTMFVVGVDLKPYDLTLITWLWFCGMVDLFIFWLYRKHKEYDNV